MCTAQARRLVAFQVVPRSRVRTAYCLLPTAYCLLPTAYRLLISEGLPVLELDDDELGGILEVLCSVNVAVAATK